MDNTNNVMLFDYKNIFCEVSKIIASLVMPMAIVYNYRVTNTEWEPPRIVRQNAQVFEGPCLSKEPYINVSSLLN